MRGLIVTGISTEVGKTVVSAILTKALAADYWKPVECGGSDTKTVEKLSGARCHPPTYQLRSPQELITMRPEKIIPPKIDRLIIEGCGGVLVPCGEGVLGTLFASWNLPWVVVSRHYLGSINHTLLTLSWLKMHGQTILGVIFNGDPYPAAEHSILKEAPYLGRLNPEKTITSSTIACYAPQFKETLKPFGTLSLNEKSTPIPSLL